MKLRPKKAPGPDGIPGEVVQSMTRKYPQYIQNMLNQLLRQGTFPIQWKRARLVLIEKAKKERDDETTYRPLCLLNTIAKMFEHVISKTINERIAGTEADLHPHQFGFRKGRSTIDALKLVQAKIEETNIGDYRSRDVCLMVTLDVKNAFNTAPWNRIMKELIARRIQPSLLQVLGSYFTDRILLVTANVQHKIKRGVPQGSVLGPLPWNIFYDKVLQIKLPSGVTTVGYVDDLVILVSGRTEEQLTTKANIAINRICEWMRANGLEIAPKKTEAIVPIARRRIQQLEIEVDNVQLPPKL